MAELGKGDHSAACIRLRDRIHDHPGKIFHKGTQLDKAVSYWRDGMEIMEVTLTLTLT